MAENSANLVWRFGPETLLDEQTRSLADAVVRYGERWMRGHSSSQDIIEELRAAQRGTKPIYPERLPAALLNARYHGGPGCARC